MSTEPFIKGYRNEDTGFSLLHICAIYPTVKFYSVDKRVWESPMGLFAEILGVDLIVKIKRNDEKLTPLQACILSDASEYNALTLLDLGADPLLATDQPSPRDMVTLKAKESATARETLVFINDYIYRRNREKSKLQAPAAMFSSSAQEVVIPKATDTAGAKNEKARAIPPEDDAHHNKTGCAMM